MTIKQISFREFIRGSMPADILMLWDKKSKKNKGVFIKPKYADEVLEYIALKEKQQKQKNKHALLDFVGKFGTLNEKANDSHNKIKASKYE